MKRMHTSLAAFAGTALLAATAFATTPPAPPVLRPAPPTQRPAPPTNRPLPPRYRPAPPPAQTVNPDSDHHHGDHWRDHDQQAANGTQQQQQQQQPARDQAWRQRDQQHRDEMKKTRSERRKAREAELEKKWGDKTLQDPKVHQEMQTHSWREARLQRLRTVAQEDNRQDLVTRIDQLEKDEQARHDKVMVQYRGAQQ